jgi:hypothetical protein
MKRSLLFFILTSGIVVILIVCILIIKNLPDHPEQSSSTSTAAFVEFKEKKQNLLNDSIPSNLTDDKNKYFYWDKEKKELKPTTTPSTKASYIKPLAGLANNNLPVQYELKKGQLTIKDNGKTLWQTPLEWWVDRYVVADSDSDGKLNINLSVWKQGNFGSHLPFWIQENDQSIKNHFFVFEFKNNQPKPTWQSSNLEHPNCEFAFADLDNDGRDELVVIEGEYREDLQCIGNYLAVWKWNGWGFSNEWRSAEGNYKNLTVLKPNLTSIIRINISK